MTRDRTLVLDRLLGAPTEAIERFNLVFRTLIRARLGDRLALGDAGTVQQQLRDGVAAIDALPAELHDIAMDAWFAVAWSQLDARDARRAAPRLPGPLLAADPYPIDRPEAVELMRTLAQLYTDERAALLLAESQGVDVLELPRGQAPLHLWRELLQLAATQRRTAAIVRAARAQYPHNPCVPVFDRLLAEVGGE